MASSNIPEKTIERLSEYRRTLLSCHKQGITHIFSHVLAGIHGITAVQVRRDLMLIGFSSDTKKGYDVKVLIDFISNILDSDTVTNIAVIGMGHLGQAITKYFNGRGLKLKITTAFDIDPAKVGQTIDGIPCHHMETFEEVVEDKNIDIVIVSSPSRVADELVVPIVNAGIKGVLNFTSRPLNFPRGIVVENYDITTLLEKVAYFVKENEENPTDESFPRNRPAPRIPPPGGYRRIVRRRTRRSQRVARGRAPLRPRTRRRKYRRHILAPPAHRTRNTDRSAPAHDARREGLAARTGRHRQSGRHPFYPRIQPDGFRRFHPPRPNRKTGRRNTRNGV